MQASGFKPINSAPKHTDLPQIKEEKTCTGILRRTLTFLNEKHCLKSFLADGTPKSIFTPLAFPEFGEVLGKDFACCSPPFPIAVNSLKYSRIAVIILALLYTTHTLHHIAFDFSSISSNIYYYDYLVEHTSIYYHNFFLSYWKKKPKNILVLKPFFLDNKPKKSKDEKKLRVLAQVIAFVDRFQTLVLPFSCAIY